MMEVEFYRLPFQFESRIRPDSPAALAAVAGSPVTADVNIPNTFDKTATFDRDLSIEFADYNYAVISGYGFWFFAHTHKANKDPVIACTFTRDPWYEYGNAKMSAIMDAMPFHASPYLKAVTGNDTMIGSAENNIVIPHLPHDLSGQYYWVQVTASKAPNTALPNGIYYYGWFIRSSDGGLTDSEVTAYDEVTYPSSRETVNNVVGILKHFNSSMASTDIIDVSVTARCPYDYIYDDVFGLTLSSRPTLTYTDTRGNHAIYALNPTDFKTDTVNVTVTDKMRLLGNIVLRDSAFNSVGNIPVNLGNITLKVYTSADSSGIYTHVKVDGYNLKFTYPEGHLPTTTSAWQDYLSLSWRYDRECMQNNVDKANAELAVNSATSITSGLISGGLTGSGMVGVATSVIGIAGNVASNEINKNALMRDQLAKEGMYMVASSSSFNTGYGTSYIRECFERYAFLDLMEPVNLTNDQLNDYIKTHGYPAVGRRTVTLSPGYWKGYAEMILNENVPVAIPKLMHDILNQELTQGIRLVHGVNDI